MSVGRTVSAGALLIVEVALAVLAVSFHYGFLAMYGDITHSAVEGLLLSFSAGVAGLLLVVVLLPTAAAVWVAPTRWVRLTAMAIPVVMVLAMLAVTPSALDSKRETQFTSSPQCVYEDMDLKDGENLGGPGVDSSRDSQEAFDSIEHVGYFGGGGANGVIGCDRALFLTEDTDVLGHYRAALPAAGWTVVTDDDQFLRAERDEMAFELVLCDHGGVVWAGPDDLEDRAQCDGADIVGFG
jgi:hypothetical protein